MIREISLLRSYANNTQPNPFYPSIGSGMQMRSGIKCAWLQKSASQINKNHIVGVTVTTFGVDGALFRQRGENALSGHFMAV